MNDDQIIQLFGVAFGKWVLGLCQNAHPQWAIAMQRSYRYVVNEEKGAVMLSLAFEVKPNFTPPTDASGISGLKLVAKKCPDERECAIKIADSVGKIRDVDEILKVDRNLWAELRDAQATLLESAGYNRDAYVAWADGGEIISKE
jgi:hypothetical protein